MDHKEKLEEAKRLYETANADQKYVLESLFPELAESEDERIRKALIEGFKVMKDGSYGECTFSNYNIPVTDIIAWLEKQCEKKSIEEHDVCKFCEDRHGCVSPCPMKLIEEEKSADKIGPKFKPGDWIIHNKNIELANSLMLVTDKVSGGYLCKYRDGQYSYNIEFVDKEYRLWTIQDAKDGDVLCTSSTTINEVFIFKGLTIEGFIECYCSYDSEGEYCEKKYHFIGKPTPATEEQRDLLFQKMKENGYEWDPEKKELKKIEQNPAEWSEEDEKYMNIVLAALYNPSAEGLYSFHKVKSSDVTNWFISLKDRVQPQSRWKPTDKDIFELQCVINNDPYNGFILKALLEQLKKLKGQ